MKRIETRLVPSIRYRVAAWLGVILCAGLVGRAAFALEAPASESRVSSIPGGAIPKQTWSQMGSLKIHPAAPSPDSTVTLTYTPSLQLDSGKGWSLFYGFKSWETSLQLRKEARLQFRDGELSTRIELPPDASYLAVLVKRPGIAEEGSEPGWWDTYLYRDDQPVRGARLEQALMWQRGKLGQESKDSRALALLTAELEAYPDNARAHGEFWGLRHQMANGSLESRDTLISEITSFLENRKDDPWAWEAAILAHNMIRRKFIVDLARQAAKRFPQEESLDSTILFHLQGRVADLEMLPTLSPRWRDSRQYWRQLFHAYSWASVEPSRLQQAGKELLARTPKESDQQGSTRIEIAEAWLKHGVEPRAVEEVAREAVSIAEVERPGLMTSESTHANSDPKVIRQFARSPLGWALYQQGRYQAALIELERAVKLRERMKVMASALYFRLGATLEKLNRPQEAQEAYLRELAWGARFEVPTRKALESLQQRLGGTQDDLEQLIRKRSNELLLETVGEYSEAVQLVDQDLGRFDLAGRDGKPIDLAQFRGKFVLLEFWATWCSPCLKSLKDLQGLSKEFPNLVVVAVSRDQEESWKKAEDYIRNQAYDYVLAFDDERKRDLRVKTVPASFLLDPSGRLRLKSLGYGPEIKLLFDQKIRSLLNASSARIFNLRKTRSFVDNIRRPSYNASQNRGSLR